MKSIVSLLNEKLDKRIIVTIADSDRRGYVFTVQPMNSIELFVKHDELIRNYGGFLTGENDAIPPLDTLVSVSSLENNDKTIMGVLQQLNKSLERSTINLLEWFTDFDELYVTDKVGKVIYQLNLTKFMKDFQRAVIGVEVLHAGKIINAIKQGAKLTLDEYGEVLKTRSPIEKGEKRNMKYVFE